ncbi:MAG: MarR family transcriptional regulator [Anaerolineales bacterium]|nr:MarR family transcriptional regulator [Anaerolineales bacterium]
MSSTEQFNQKLRQWTELMSSRSMADTVRFVKQADLSFAQLGALMQLHHGRQCGVTDIAARLGVTNAAASQLVDKLVQAGLVERAEVEHDRRLKALSLTAQGRACVEAAHQARLGWIAALSEQLSSAQRAAAIHTFDDLLAAAQALPAPEPAPAK